MLEENDQQLSEVLAELSRREPIFHRPEFGTTRADFEKMTAEDFWEIGASGQRYSRADVLNELERRSTIPHEDIWETSDFRCRRLARDVYLLTYQLVQNRVRQTRRSTIWQRTAEGWKIVYHQGTIMQESYKPPFSATDPLSTKVTLGLSGRTCLSDSRLGHQNALSKRGK